jgi:hypothetical protein
MVVGVDILEVASCHGKERQMLNIRVNLYLVWHNMVRIVRVLPPG